MSSVINDISTPGAGIHRFRLFNFAIVDVIGTLIAAYVISYYTATKFSMIIVLLLVVSVFIHYLFSVRTTLTVMLLG